MRRINLACPKAYYLTYIRDVHPSRGSTFNPLSRWGDCVFLAGRGDYRAEDRGTVEKRDHWARETVYRVEKYKVG